MKGLFQTSLAVAAIIIGAQARHAHMHHRRLEKLHHQHHEKRALVVITKTQEVVEIEYVTRIVYVEPSSVQAQAPTSSSQQSSFYTSTTRSTTPSTTTTTTTTTSSPPPPPPTTTTTTFTPPSLPTEVIPLVVPQSSSTTTTTTTTTTTPPPPPPTTTTTTTTTYAAPPAQSTSPATGGGQMYSGQGTYYACGLGSCGKTNSDSDYVVALSHLLMTPQDGGNPNTNPLCGRQVRVFSAMAPEGVVFTVEDKCPGCGGMYDLDICQGPFLQHLGTEAEGRIDITWQWI